MKKNILAASLVFLFVAGYAQDQQTEFVKAQDENWLVNIEEAYALSKETNKPILANFTGSDWCGWCKKLRAEVFSQPEFIEWAEENVILLELDFPRRKQLPVAQQQQNRNLQQAFQVTGFPTVWMFDLHKPNEENNFQLQAYGKTGYMYGGAEKYTKELDKMIAKKNKN